MRTNLKVASRVVLGLNLKRQRDWNLVEFKGRESLRNNLKKMQRDASRASDCRFTWWPRTLKGCCYTSWHEARKICPTRTVYNPPVHPPPLPSTPAFQNSNLQSVVLAQLSCFTPSAPLHWFFLSLSHPHPPHFLSLRCALFLNESHTRTRLTTSDLWTN